MGAASERLKTLIELSDHRLRNALAALWRHPRLDEVYPGLLLAAYSVMRGTVPVMERARDSADRVVKANGDAACAALSRYLTAHIPEERGHDQWVLDDLQALGFDRRQMEKRLPSPASAAMVGAQYYWIDHVDPVAVLGYVAVVEGDPPREDDILAIVEQTGLPVEAFSNMLRHARLDPAHQAEFDEALDAMPLTERQWDIVGVSAVHSAGLYAQLIEEVVSSVDESVRAAAV